MHTALSRPNLEPGLIFDALGEPTRRAIVDRLSRGPASVSSLAEPLGVTLAAVLQHVQVLEQASLVTSRKVGRVRTCSLDQTGLRAAESWIAERRTAMEQKLDRLAEVLGE
ncbi:MAG TPA: metalloregulator ArsR/SmtB family transcription factor [Trueperaceae bacterium]|nr:metalloregulator ArsR/SmtB family transcription factor [Trueperaceae bacterium]